MANVETVTVAQAAKSLGIAVGTFRKKAKAAGLTAYETIQSGKRGRPANLYSKAAVAKLAK